MHPRCRAEPGLNLVANDEAGLFIEAKRMQVRGDLNSPDSTAARHRDVSIRKSCDGAVAFVGVDAAGCGTLTGDVWVAVVEGVCCGG